MAHEDGGRVRLRDVAARAGVSVGSASQAFGRPELVSEAVRGRVLAAAEELGYTGPHPTARRLRTGRAGAIGMIFSERLRYQFTDPAAPAFLGGIAQGLEEQHLGLLLIPDARDRATVAETVRGAAVDGFIVYSATRNDLRVQAALERGVPVVTVDQPRDLPTPFVGIDDRAAARAAAEHVVALGHERVGVLSFVTTLDPAAGLQLDITVDRLAGYRDGLAGRWDELRVRTVRPNAPEPAALAARELLSGHAAPTAILTMSDVLALGVLRAAAELGLRVPEDLSVVGFDDSAAASLASPPLTTVAQPHEEKGRLAAQWLVEAIEAKARPGRRRRRLLPTKLVVRSSTAPARKR
jgi:DNA-binding LacI/PurR family transcriptional regulator